MTNSKPKICLEHLIKIYGEKPHAALKLFREGRSKDNILQATGQVLGIADVSVTVNKGELFVVMGLSGSGKSTLVRCINRLINPTSGHIYIDDEDVVHVDEKRMREIRLTKVSMVFQGFGLFPHKTVAENVEYGLKVRGIDTRQRRQKALSTLEAVGLAQWADYLPDSLSGGMQQRVGLARALATEAEILLMDEPFSALDPLIRRDMQNLFLDIQGEVKRTVVFVTHDLDEALRLGHRVAIMKDGEIVQLGTPEQILREPANEYVERFVEDVDYAKVRIAESVMVAADEVAYPNEGPMVVLRRMKQAGVDFIPVVDDERRLVGLAEVEEVDRLAERNERELKAAVDTTTPRIGRHTWLREILPLFVERDVPVAVVGGEDERLEGIVVHGSLIAGLTTSVELSNGAADTTFDGARPEGATLRGSEAGRVTDEEG